VIALDTNLLVYAHRSGLPEHRGARRAIENASRDPRGWGVTLPNVTEFWSVVTHPDSRGGPSSAAQASGFLDALRTAGARTWLPGAGFVDRLLALAGRLEVQGPRVFDLQIGLTAFDNGAVELWTHDSRFFALPGLRIHDPLT
jgi:predicted nucleic acid-binding protein